MKKGSAKPITLLILGIDGTHCQAESTATKISADQNCGLRTNLVSVEPPSGSPPENCLTSGHCLFHKERILYAQLCRPPIQLRPLSMPNPAELSPPAAGESVMLEPLPYLAHLYGRSRATVHPKHSDRLLHTFRNLVQQARLEVEASRFPVSKLPSMAAATIYIDGRPVILPRSNRG